MKAQGLVASRQLPIFAMLGILTGCAGMAVLPEQYNKPSSATQTTVNGISIAVPEGWESVPLDPSEVDSPMVIHLANENIRCYVQVHKIPGLLTKQATRGYEQTVVNSAFPDHELTFGPFAVRASAMAPIVSRYKTSIVVEGQRKPIAFSTAYNIAQGITSYFVDMQCHESVVRAATTAAVEKIYKNMGVDGEKSYDWTAIGFNDFLAIVNSL